MVKTLNSSANKNKHDDFDAIIIGTGPGGEGAAMNLAKQQKNVAIIERYHKIEYFVNTTFNYPSMAEAFRVTALNDLNRLF